MIYCILDDNNIIVNTITCDSDESAKAFNAVPAYEGCGIGDKYNPPIPISQMDRLEAQTTYTAMMTNTLIGG